MKMSNLFEGLYRYGVTTLPAINGVIQKAKRIKDPSEIEGISVTTEFLFKLTPIQMQAIELAVNNHDALVELLDSLVDDFEAWGEDGYCKSCRARVTHKEDCDYQKSINLLDKIKDESNEN